jgi:hypothetical protein
MLLSRAPRLMRDSYQELRKDRISSLPDVCILLPQFEKAYSMGQVLGGKACAFCRPAQTVKVQQIGIVYMENEFISLCCNFTVFPHGIWELQILLKNFITCKRTFILQPDFPFVKRKI